MAAQPAPIRPGRVLLGVIVAALAMIGLLHATGVALGIGSVVAVLAMLGAYGIAQRDSGTDPPASTVLRYCATGMVSVLALAGLATLIGPAATPIALVVLGIGGGWLWWRHGRPGRVDEREGEPDNDLAALSNAELGRAWQLSHAELANVRSAAELARLYALRRRQLDEMERRDPTGFRRWIGSGSWVTSNSAPFLGGS